MSTLNRFIIPVFLIVLGFSITTKAQVSEDVAAINIGSPDMYEGDPRDFVEVDGKIFYTETANQVIWVSDGTEEGTQKISVEEWSNVSLSNDRDNQSIAVLGDKLYFKNYEGIRGNLWITDGTEEGSQEVVNLESEGLMSITEIATFGNRVGFYALTEEDDYNVYLIDESGTGIEQITEINNVPFERNRPKIAVIGADLYVIEENGADRSLVRIDQNGTATTLWDFPQNSTEDNLEIGSLIAAGDKLFFEANDGSGYALWAYDINEETLNRMFDPHEDAKQNRLATNITPVGDNVYFYTYPWDADENDFSIYAKLYISDGTPTGTYQIWNESLLGDGLLTNEPSILPTTEVNGKLLFVAPNEIKNGDRTWWTIGETASSLAAILDDGEYIEYASSAEDPETVSSGAWFAGDFELYFTDGTNEGTFKISSDDFIFIRHMNIVGDFPWFSSTLSGRFTETNVAWRVGNIEDLTPTRPNLLQPENNADNVSSLTTFTWEPGIVASEYDLQVSVNEEFTDIIVTEEAISDTTFTLSDSLEFETEFYWRARGINGKNVGLWSDTLNFTTGAAPPEAPSLTTPSDETTNFPLVSTFYWDGSDRAETYRFQLSANEAFTELHADTLVELDRYALDDSLQYGTMYYWRVQAENINGKSDWSEIRSLTTEEASPAKIILIEPENEANNISLNPKFVWNKDEATEDYILQIAEDDSFEDFTDVEFTEDTTVTLETSLDTNTLYYWRVRGVNRSHNGPWSEIREFTTLENDALGQVVLISPEDEQDSVSVTPDFEWQRVINAEEFQFQLAADEDFESVVLDSAEITGTSLILSDSLQYTATYYWRVRAITSSEEGAWSESWNFTTQIEAPGPVLLLNPGNESTITNDEPPVLTWTASERASEYILHFAEDEEFEEIMIDTTLTISDSGTESTDTTFTVEEELFGNETYYWRLKAANYTGESDWSEKFNFMISGGLSTETESMPDKFTLEQNYPNPFNPTTQIRYGIPNASEVRLDVYNMLGQKVATLVNEQQTAGWHSVTFDASGLSSGFYIYRIQANDFVKSKKLMLIK